MHYTGIQADILALLDNDRKYFSYLLKGQYFNSCLPISGISPCMCSVRISDTLVAAWPPK